MLHLSYRIRLSPTVLPTVAAVCLICLTSYLGFWQQGRAAEKQALQREFDRRIQAKPVELGVSIIDPLLHKYSRAVAQGEWVPGSQIYIDNKFDNNAVGFHVVAALKISKTNRYLLVNRGWVPRTAGYPLPPSVTLPQGPVSIEGMLVLPSMKFLELSEATIQGKVWQNLTIERYAHEAGLNVLPLLLLERDPTPPLHAVTERPDARVEKHVEYMLTWYALAATVAVIWLILNVKLERLIEPATTEADRRTQGKSAAK